MKNIVLILSAAMMILNFCGSTMAETPQPQHELVEESPVPPESPMPDIAEPLSGPEPSAEPEAAAPSPEITPIPSTEPSIFDLFDTAATPSPAYQVDMAAYYLEDMRKAAIDGDVKAGRAAEESRNAAIEAAGSDEEKISFDDLYLLARVIYSEAGSDWLDEEFRLCVGEVVLNRVASPEYPDSIHDVVYQKGQYTGVNTIKFANLKPGEDCVDAALKLLQGERRMVPSVVYQSDCIQGELFSMYSDRHLGNTYFCLSPNLELYPID